MGINQGGMEGKGKRWAVGCRSEKGEEMPNDTRQTIDRKVWLKDQT